MLNALRQWWLKRPLLPEEQAVLAVVHEKYGKCAKDVLFFVKEEKPLLPVQTSAILQVWGKNGDGPWVNLTNHAGFIKLGHSTLTQVRAELP
jgi:hypothetical protein